MHDPAMVATLDSGRTNWAFRPRLIGYSYVRPLRDVHVKRCVTDLRPGWAKRQDGPLCALGARARRDGAVRGVRRAHRRTRALRTESQPRTLATGAPCGALGRITSAVAAATRVQTPMAMRRALGARARRDGAVRGLMMSWRVLDAVLDVNLSFFATVALRLQLM